VPQPRPCQFLAKLDPNTASQIQREVTSPTAQVERIQRDTARYKESVGKSVDLGIPCSIHLSYRGVWSSKIGVQVLPPLQGGAFQTTTVSSRVNVNINTNLFTRALIRYNSDTDQIMTNLRLNLIHRPGSDLYIVYDERDDVEADLDAIVRTLIVKVDYLLSF